MHRYNISWGVSIKALNGINNTSSTPGFGNKAGDKDFSSPLPNTHWVLPNVLCGQTAGRMSQKELKMMVEDYQINTFVCLQTSYKEYGCNDYREILSKRVFNGSLSPPPFEIKFMHCPIPDLGIIQDNSLIALIAELQRILRENHGHNSIYIHCYGGHGRTGLVCVNLISAIEGIGPLDAMKRLCKSHSYRMDEYSSRCTDCALSEEELEDEEQMEQTKNVQGVMERQALLNKS